MAKKQKGSKFKCEECGLVVIIDETCACEPTCELVCCETPMKEVKPKSKKQVGEWRKLRSDPTFPD
jgi:hypothetical protein